MSSEQSEVAKGEEPEAKRQRTEESLSETLICPITLELPFVPVIAEDGRIYEKQAILQHIEDNDSLRSPYTNETMGSRLVDSHQIKSVIETSIQNGSIKGDLAANWLEKKKNQDIVEQWRKDAEKGDGKAEYMIGRAHYYGGMGLEEDEEAAKPYWKIASDAGDVNGQVMHGETLLQDEYLPLAERFHGLALISQAAGSGLSYACCFLGEIYAGEITGLADRLGLKGFPTQKIEAIRLLEKGISGRDSHSIRTDIYYVPMSFTNDNFASCKQWLQELKAEE